MKKTTLRQVAFKLAIVALVLLSPLGLRAQTLAEYTVTTSTETYTSIADATLLLSSVNGDGGTQTVTLPFNFPFGENTYPAGTTLTVRADGYVYFGSTSPGHSSNGAWTNTTSNYYLIAPFLNYDGKITANGATSGAYCTTDDPDNPTMLIIEFKSLMCYYPTSGGGNGDYNFQLRLHSNGNISTVYGESTLSTYSSATQNFFLNAKADKICLTGSYAEPVAGTPSALPNFTTAPVAGQVITFVRPVITCPKPVSISVTDASAPDALTVEWVAGGGESEWNVYLNGVQDNTDPITEQTYTFQNLTANTPYTLGVTAVCGTDDESLPRTTTARTACAAIDDLTTPYTMGFETDDLQGTTNNTLSIPWCWNRLNNATSSTYNYYPYANNSSSEAHGGSRYLRFYYYNSSYSWSSQADYQIVVLPEIDVDALPLSTLRLRFYARSYSSYSGDISVGTMSDLDDPDSFNEVESFNITGTTYDLKTVANFPDDGSRYIAIRMLKPAAAAYQYAYIDDLTLELLPNCMEPTDLHEVANSATTESVELEWTDAAASEWEIYYTDDPTDVPDNTTDAIEEGIVDNPYLLENLQPATHYYAYVRANCGGEQSPWSQAAEFGTACDAVTTFPWSENFESRASGNFSDPCWENEHLVSVSNRTEVFKVYTSTNGTNSTHQLQLPDMQAGNTVKLRLPKMTLSSDNYQFTLDVYRSNSTYNANNIYEGVRVYVSTDGELEGATELTFIPRQYNTSSTLIPEENATGWYTYELPLGISGTCYIILQGESQYCTATYMDNFVVEQVPTCRKPTSPVCNAKTAHTATLSWTNGEAGQTEWEIAYKAGNNFNPNDDAELENATLVPADENPYTIEDLAQSTTYYAYVRANCGGDYSAWSVAYVSFQTLAGNVTPTGLAVAANTITSDQATASWNAVAGNTQHESYDIYWAESTVTSVPDEPAAPNLISGISATSQLIEGLEPEHTYKVWVRDNCGTDGLSAWSSAVTFTTASACNTPSNLVASNVTNNSAQLSWAAYGIDDFNLQYRVSGEEWDDNNIIYNVNTPYILSLPLTGNTTYQVRVQATCTTDDSWSNVASFTTACDAESFPWSENFDTWTTKSVCWSFRSGQYNMGQGTPTTSSSAWSLSSSYGSYITIDGKALTMNLYSDNRYWAVTPAIDITTDDAVLKVDVAMSAWSAAAPNYDDNDTLAFAISTDGGNTFTNLRVLDGGDLNNLGNDYTTIYVPVAGYNGQAVRFAIYGGSINNVSSSNDNRCVIDNVSVEEAPACYPVGTLAAATNVTATSADLSWTLVDNTQTSWRVKYATDQDLLYFQTAAATENPFTLNSLTPSTHYWVAVYADCGGEYGELSNIIDFTTDIACAAPTDLTLVGSTTESLTVDWTENGTVSMWTVCYKAEGEEYFNCNQMVNEHPYTIGNLQPGTNYTVKVTSNCSNNYPSPELTNGTTYFQTVANCPAPTNLAVTDGSVDGHGATITWEGNSDNDSYTIEYGTATGFDNVTIFEEDFEGGSMPTGWTTTSTGSNNWSVSSSVCSGEDPYNSSDYAAGTPQGTSGRTEEMYLITPAVDLSDANSATLSFHYYQRAWGSDTDPFGVYYRVNGGEWQQLFYSTTSTSGWTEKNIALEGLADNYQIGFYRKDNYAHGNAIDDVVITAQMPTFTWNPTPLATNATSPYVINTLNPETQYVVRVKGVCTSGTDNLGSNIVGFTTPEACPAPTNVTVNNSTITDHSAEISWDGSASSYNVRYRTATYRPTYYFNDFNESSATGWSYSAPFIYGLPDPIYGTDGDNNFFLTMGWSTTDEETIISPELPAYSNGSVVEFYYFGYSISNTFQVGYSSTTSDADAFTWGSPITAPLTEYTLYSEQLPAGTKYVAFKATASEQGACIFIDNFGIYNTEVPAGDWTTTTANSNSTEIDGLTESTLYDVEVQAVCGSDLSAWVATTFTTLEACAAPTAFTQVAVAADEATFSWTAGNGNTSWDVYVKAQGGDYPSTPNATVNTPEATIDNLVANTSYSVKIVPDCDGTKSLEVANAFHTLCSVIAIDADNPYNEGFEGTVDCWSTGDPETTSGNGYNWTLNTSYVHSNNYSITNGNYYGPVYLYTPTFNITGANAALSFWSYNRYPNDYDKNSVLVTTDGGANWTEIWSPSSVSEEWVPTTIDLTGYIGQNIKFCFLFEGNNAHQWFIDDVELYIPASYTKDVDANKWYAISTPVHNNGNNETLAGVTNLTNEANDLYLYNENEGKWVKETASLAPGKGYIYRRVADATLTFVGIDNTGSIEPTITNSCADNTLAGFNLVGNPYPYAVNPDMSCYKLTPAGTWKVKTTSENVEVCEAVLVYTDDASTTVTFTTASKSSAASTAIAFTVSNGEFEDVAYANLGNGDNLPKIGHLTAEAPMLSIPMEGRRYAIANLGEECESFNMVFRGTGEYTLSVNSANSGVSYLHLIDQVTGKDIDLLKEHTYTFTATGSDADRFTVKLRPEAAESTNGHFAYWNGNNWVVEGEGTLQVFDVLGRKIASHEVSSELSILNSQFPSTGVYVLRMGEKSQKIVVR